MPRPNAYLVILGCAVAAWFLLYPVLFATTSDQLPIAVHFLRTRPRYVFFGDSVFNTTTECESDHRNIAQLLPGDLAARTLAFNAGGGNANLWRSAAHFISARSGGSVTAAIIPINMSVFSVQWEHNPDYLYEQGRMFYDLASAGVSMNGYLGDLAQLHSFSKSADYRRATIALANTKVLVGQHAIGVLQTVVSRTEMPKLPCRADLERYAYPLGQRFALNYGAPISPSDPYFAYLNEMVVRFRQAHIRPILYLTPLNLEDIKRFGGGEVFDQLGANLALVRRIAKAGNWELIDLSAALSRDHFITRECGCEHVDSVGRSLIAAQVAAALQRDGLAAK